MSIEIDTADIAANLNNADLSQFYQIVEALDPEAFQFLAYQVRRREGNILNVSREDVIANLDGLAEFLDRPLTEAEGAKVVELAMFSLDDVDPVQDMANELIHAAMLNAAAELGLRA